MTMDIVDAIRKRRAVRAYTERPVPDELVDRLLRLALAAPTGSGAQAWSLMVVRDPERRRALADLIIAGGATYFATIRPRKEGVSDQEQAEWGRDYAEKVLATYRVAPVWIVGLLVPRGNYPDAIREGGHADDLISVAFAMENLMLAARAEGLGTVPTTFQRFETDAVRGLLGLPEEVDAAIVTPLGYPEAFPEGRPPALRKFRAWKSLVHDERWGETRE